jgi:hypothetical protein
MIHKTFSDAVLDVCALRRAGAKDALVILRIEGEGYEVCGRLSADFLGRERVLGRNKTRQRTVFVERCLI